MQTTKWARLLRQSIVMILGFILLAIITGPPAVGEETASCSAELPDGTEKCEVICERGETAICGRNEAQVWCYCEEQ